VAVSTENEKALLNACCQPANRIGLIEVKNRRGLLLLQARTRVQWLPERNCFSPSSRISQRGNSMRFAAARQTRRIADELRMRRRLW
jgi:hypothetical protein